MSADPLEMAHFVTADRPFEEIRRDEQKDRVCCVVIAGRLETAEHCSGNWSLGSGQCLEPAARLLQQRATYCRWVRFRIR